MCADTNKFRVSIVLQKTDNIYSVFTYEDSGILHHLESATNLPEARLLYQNTVSNIVKTNQYKILNVHSSADQHVTMFEYKDLPSWSLAFNGGQ